MAREQKFALDKGGDKRLLVRWKGIWKNVEVVLDGVVLGEPFPNFKALKQGGDFKLPDGRTLHVQFVTGAFAMQGLTLLIDGRPLAGSSADPRMQIKLAAGLIYFVAGLSALLGILGMAGVKFLAYLGFHWPSLVGGILLGGLGFVGVRYKSRAAFAVAAGVMVVDTVLTLALSVQPRGQLPTAGLFLRVMIIVAIIRGIKAIGAAADLEKREIADSFR